MTDEHNDRPLPRLDLRALDVAEDPARNEVMVQAVLERVTTSRVLPVEWWESMARAQRRAAAVAAVLLFLAGAVLFTGRETRSDALNQLIEEWVMSNHVPTNGELLAAYKGYSR